MRFFILNWFGHKTHLSSWLTTYSILILTLNSPRYLNFRAFHIFSEYGQFHSTYFQHYEFFILQIISIRTVSFCLLSANATFFLKWNTHSAYSQFELNFVPSTLSVYAKFYSAYSHHMLIFITSIISIQTISFSVLSTDANFFLISSTYSECAYCHSAYYQYRLNFTQQKLSIQNVTSFFTAFKGIILQKWIEGELLDI
jgi:hypothetical protein